MDKFLLLINCTTVDTQNIFNFDNAYYITVVAVVVALVAAVVAVTAAVAAVAAVVVAVVAVVAAVGIVCVNGKVISVIFKIYHF
jgi:hypothetical protein